MYWASTNPCALAAEGGHLDALKYARQQGCPWDEWTCLRAALAWAPGCAEVGAGAPLLVDQAGLCICFMGAAVGAGARLPVERGDVFLGRCGRAPGGAAVGAGARLPVEYTEV